ncbi:hypothetical protein [Falsiroseomonas selenitidurans]|uniref:Lipoprotein n=1 Tax=Falsiroseomonas selenitidurans TaxID=2716335 RepID=A0ABX1EAW4_9PROT|nr:hypothetical protein [Falsiroseomonas selenitidurans]NKC34370.1 hypothetical protein [Falsiroseomonas selenitidurans]
MMRAIRLFPLLAVLGACAQGPTLDQRLSTHIGESESELVARMGVPLRVHEADGRRFLQFEDRRTVPVASYPGPYHAPAYGPWGPAFGGWPQPGGLVQVTCAITFALRDGRVEGFSRRGEGC